MGIDEEQFFDNQLVCVANQLAARGVRVIIAGLDQDYTGQPWEPMPQLLAIAEYSTKDPRHLHEVRPASQLRPTQLRIRRARRGRRGMYEARCRNCSVPHADALTVDED